ncbi:hypothetical protein [Aureimonas mangrovi]|uniref:hypothetical protein n=1 Tax=Aureimonas mangrovi TaxID=2758041 RepID=UPI001FEA50C2|nr:hypothetical protein [Aureimonas mangrovi]
MPTGRNTFALATLLLALHPGASAVAQDVPVYKDDRSDPGALIQSLYNAIERREYLRAWSYFDEGVVADPERFSAGYEQTAHVRLKLGEVTGEGAAGSLYGSVPVAVEATAEDGTVSVFTGCYETRQVQPAAQIEPPFSPIRIIAGKLEETTASLDSAVGDCPQEGL